MTQPAGLAEISLPLPWHSTDWAQVSEQLFAGQLPHALLLSGAQYTGKTQFALALSRLLLCAQAENGHNCGHCHACELSRSGGHGDFKWVEPEKDSRVIKVDQVRDAIAFTTKTAGFGLRKSVVLAPADTMNLSAFNALLKSLEEPAADTYLVLVCHGMHRVPATIRSRCQILRLTEPDRQTCLEWLDQTTDKREDSETLLDLADERPLLAQQLYHSAGAEEFAARRLAIRALLHGKISVTQAGALWKDEEVEAFLEHSAREIQQLLLNLSRNELQTATARAAFDLLDELARLRQAVGAGANPNKQLLLDAILSKFHRELGGGLLGDTI